MDLPHKRLHSLLSWKDHVTVSTPRVSRGTFVQANPPYPKFGEFQVKTHIARIVLVASLGLSFLYAYPETHAATHAKPKPSASHGGDAHAGQAVFMQRCFQCHSVQENEKRVGPSLFHELQKPHSKRTDAEVREIVHSGKNKMPAWKGILSEDDINNVIAYLHTL
jgi:mono/diheme cytochrome c family protein